MILPETLMAEDEQDLKAKKQYIEDFGLYFEEQNMPRMAGRILGLLLVCQPAHQSADDIVAMLDASRGTVSTMTRMLARLGMIEKIGRPGERRDYFRIQPNLWVDLFESNLGEISNMRQVAERGLKLMEGAPQEECKRLGEMYRFYAFLEKELPELVKRYRDHSPGSAI